MSSKGSIFRMFNPGRRPKEEDTGEKRREQLRRAQHVYRQRKTRYVKALETDVKTSRLRECQILAEKKHLEDDVQMLLRILAQHGIATPELSSSRVNGNGASPGQLTQSESPMSHDGSQVYTHTEWPQASTFSPPPLPSPFSISPDDNTSLSSRVCEFDQTTLGMKFVLKIEEPCLGHIHGNPKTPEEPSNHALTATSQLLSLSSSSTPPPKRSSLLPVQNTPAGILDRLLTLAPEVVTNSETEVTPIQAWDEIQRKPMLGNLDLRGLMALAERLRDAAKCHGFGAVVEVEVFQRLVREMVTSKVPF
ncbi:uncharacterized protein C8A04DRAFT_30683 [Dichotomopilus funicola]|uniref:BZIP domain-containing protein n=1 Tax=Dichotomopilus funicola TaxID=1934379 RepID=A0AAN6ZLI4_9PEZI|nr:hypothetical protein C8A04DRAFT_30683 [Dichotomopilus funicola]